jgi:hypothetical protein
MGLTVNESCNLRFIHFLPRRCHPDTLTPELTRIARETLALFARKLPNYGNTVTDFLNTEIKSDKEGDFPPQKVFEQQIDPCGLKKWPMVLAMYHERQRIISFK